MKYCTYCGQQINDEASFCPSCGAQQNSAVNQNNQNNQNAYQNQGNLYQYAPPAYNQQPYYPGNESNGMAIAGFVCSFFSPLLGWIFGGVGLSKANKLPSGKGRGLAIAALVISTLSFLIAVVYLTTRR